MVGGHGDYRISVALVAALRVGGMAINEQKHAGPVKDSKNDAENCRYGNIFGTFYFSITVAFAFNRPIGLAGMSWF